MLDPAEGAEVRQATAGQPLTFPHFAPHFPHGEWTLPAILEHQADLQGDRPFLSWQDGGEAESFAAVNATVNRLAHGMAAFGIAKGDFVGLLLPNCPEYIYAWFALSKLGAVEVAISDAYKGAFLAHPLRLGGVRTLIASPALAARVAEIEDDLPALERIVILDPPGEGVVAPPRFKRLHVSRFQELITEDTANPGVRVTPRDTAAILMTSGTTGPSKGVIMSHAQTYFIAEEAAQLVRLRDDDVYMTGFPLFHANAQFMTAYPCLITGAHMVLYRSFSASDWSGRAQRSGATVTNLLGATTAFILAQAPSPADKAHRLRRIYAAPMPPELLGAFTERFGIPEYLDGFGQTEISLVFMTPPGVARPAGASGVIADQWFDVRLVDPETGEDVEQGKIGELLIRPKAPGIICDGYLGMPEKTVEAWRDLWFHTGDGLRRDAEGWYYFKDRIKDALRRRGENISSFEVEAVIRSHPIVVDCAVVGVRADEHGGEDEVMAYVVPRPGAEPRHADIIDWCDDRMPAFMVPRYVEFLAELPRTPTEKIRKKELRERGVTSATWDRVQVGFQMESELAKGPSRRKPTS